MQIGVPKESKNHEYRVGMTPGSVQHLTRLGHEVWVQTSAGSAIGFSDAQYQHAGAVIVNADQAFAAPLVIKVKEPSVKSAVACMLAKYFSATYIWQRPEPRQAY